MSDFTTEQTRTAAYSAAEVIERCRTDFDFFCRLCAPPDIYTSSFPAFYIGVFWKIVDGTLKERDLSKYAIGIPRAHAKTTFVKLVIAWLLAFSKKKYFMILGSIVKKASDIITAVIDLLESPNMVALFGHWNSQATKNSLEEKTFEYAGRQITLMAAGPGGSLVRGTSKGFQRPDFILMDDMITEEDAASPAVSEQRYLWILGTLLPAGDPKNCQYIYLGNKYAGKGCILTKLEASRDWVSLVVGAILSDGQPLWPELHSLESLMERLRSYLEANHPEIFFAEFMNYVGTDNVTQFDFSTVEVFDPTPDMLPEADWLIIDPAGGKEGSDGQAIGHIQAFSARPHIKSIQQVQESAPSMVLRTLAYCLENRVPIIFVEGGGYQVTLIQWFDHFIKDKGILGIKVIEIPVASRAKAPRIMSGLRALAAKEITISNAVRSPVYAEIRIYNPLKSHNLDNALDVLAYATESLVKYPGEIVAAQYYFGQSTQTENNSGILIESEMV